VVVVGDQQDTVGVVAVVIVVGDQQDTVGVVAVAVSQIESIGPSTVPRMVVGLTGLAI